MSSSAAAMAISKAGLLLPMLKLLLLMATGLLWWFWRQQRKKKKWLRLHVSLWPGLSVSVEHAAWDPASLLLRAVNRALHRSPLPLQIETITFHEMRLSLPWSEVFKIRSWRLYLRGLHLVGRMTHLEEWDEWAMLRNAVALKRQEADLSTLLVETRILPIVDPSSSLAPAPISLTLRCLDHLFGGLYLELEAFRLWINDYKSDSCMGLHVSRLSCEPSFAHVDSSSSSSSIISCSGSSSRSSSSSSGRTEGGAVLRHIEAERLILYVDPTVSVTLTSSSPSSSDPSKPEEEEATHLPVCEIGRVTVQIELPAVGAVLCALESRPEGKKRRLTINGAIIGLRGQLRPAQTHHFFFHLLHVFFGGAHRAWRSAIIQKHREEGCRRLREEEREHYLSLDRQLQALEDSSPPMVEGAKAGEGPASAAAAVLPLSLWPRKAAVRKKELKRGLAALEEMMSYAEIVHLRCQAREWGRRGLVTAATAIATTRATSLNGDAAAMELTTTKGVCLVEKELEVDDSHPLAAEFAALASVLAQMRAQYWFENKAIREVWLETVRIEDIEIEWYGAYRPNGHISAPLDFDGSLEVTVHAGCLSGEIRILHALDPLGIAVGEDGLQEEPDQGWFQIKTHLERFCFINAAEEAVKHVTPFLLCGPYGESQRAEPTATADAGPLQQQVHWTLQLWSSGRRHESLSFEECRLAGYIPRVLSVIAAIIAPFRPPAVRYWTHDVDLAAFWDWGRPDRLLEDEIIRRGSPSFMVVEESGRSTTLSTSLDNSHANPSSTLATTTDGPPTKPRKSDFRTAPRLLEGWWLRYFVGLGRCEILLIANPEDAESAMLSAKVSATALVACAPETGEAVDLKVDFFALLPTVLDRDRRWLRPQTLPATFPKALHEGPRGAGLWQANRMLLEPLQATLHYSLESRRAVNALAALSAVSVVAAAGAVEAQEEEDGQPLMLHHSPSRRRRIMSEQTNSPWDAEARIPRCVRLDIRQTQMSLEATAGAAGEGEEGVVVVPTINKADGLIIPALLVRCGGESHLIKSYSGAGGDSSSSSNRSSSSKGKAMPPSPLPSSPASLSSSPLAPAAAAAAEAAAAALSSSSSWTTMFEAALEFVTAEMSSRGDVEVILDVVDLGPPKKGVEEEEEEWPVMATGVLLLEPPLDGDDDDEDESSITHGPSKSYYRQKREVALTGLGPWEGLVGRLQVDVEIGLRLLTVTVHKIQHLLTLTEDAGREARPFLEVSVGELHSQTDQLSGLPDEVIEHEMIFAAEGTAPLLSVELKTLEGRVHERVRAQAMMAVGRGTKDQGLLPLKDPKGIVLCEVCLRAHWIDDLDDLAVPAATATTTISKAGGAISRQSVTFAQALSRFERQSFVMKPEAAIVQMISVDLSEVLLKGTEMDLALLVATLHSFWKKSCARSAVGGASGGEIGEGGGEGCGGGGGMLTRRISRINSMSQMKDAADGDARERWWKRTIYGIFKEVDQDKDDRLNCSELVEMLHRLAADLYLTHSEAAVQINRLLHSMGWSDGGEGGKEGESGKEDKAMSWPGFREALVRAVEVYEFEHAGWLFNSVRCREFSSGSVLRKAFPTLSLAQASYAYYTNFSSSSLSAAAARQSLAGHLARFQPESSDPLAAFWNLLEHETKARRGGMDLGGHVEPGQSPSQAHAALQAMLVRALKNYKLAKDAWRLVVVPAWHGLPALRGVNRDGYEVMGAPVSVGDAVYSDIKGAELISLPPALASQVLMGLRTPHRDRKARGPRVVSLHLNAAATLYVCYDRAISKIPAWLTDAGFCDTRLFVRTTMAMYHVWELTTLGPGRIVLGGNEGFGKVKGQEKQAFECFNYFVLVSAVPGASPPTTAVPLPARWLLQDNSPAYLGGQPLHDHLFAALGVGGARLSPLRIANAKDMAGKEEGETALGAGPPLHMEYNFHFYCPGAHLALLDGQKNRSLTSKLDVRTQAVTANISLERPLDAEEDSWLGLGRTDRLEGDLELVSLAASYLNTSLSAPELVVEPWGCRCVMRNRLDSAITTVRVDAPKHLNINISPSLSDVLQGVWRPFRFDPRRYRASFETPSDTNRIARVVLVNRLGVPLKLRPASFGCRIVASSQPQQQEQRDEMEQQLQEEDMAGTEDMLYDGSPRLVVLEEGEQVELELEQPLPSQQAASSGRVAASSCHRVNLQPLGWKPVAEVSVSLAGAQAYHLSPAHRHRVPIRPGSAPSKPPPAKKQAPGGRRPLSPVPAHKRKPSNSSQQQHSFSHADVSLSHKILMVVDAKEYHDRTETGQGSITAAALHVEVRTNVRLMNMTGVVVDAKLGRGGDGVRDFLLPQGTMAMPLSIVRQQPMLSLRRLSEGDDHHETHSPGMGKEDSGVLLHPALFDVRTHEALRRTRGLEERSLSLHHRVLGTVATGDDDVGRVEIDEAKLSQDGSESKEVRTEDGEEKQQQQEQQHTPEKKIVKSPSSTEASAASIKIARSIVTPLVVAVDWTLAILPPYQLSNTLPCLIEVEAFQPKHLPQRRTRTKSHSGDGEKGTASGLPTSSLLASSSSSSTSLAARKRRADPASDLFSLPMGLMPLVSSASDARVHMASDDSNVIANDNARSVRSPTSPGGGREGLSDDGEQGEAEIMHATHTRETGTAVLGPAEDIEMVWSGRLRSGNHANLEQVKLDRALYIRVRLILETRPGPWSVPVHIPSWTHLDRVAFNDDRESGRNERLDVSWMDGGGEYHGDIRFVRRWRLKGARRLVVCADYWILNKTGLALSYQPTPLPDVGGRMSSPRFDEAAVVTGNGGDTEPAPRHSPFPPEWAVAVAAAGAAAPGGNRRLISDGMHRACFGRTTRVPLLLGCPAKTLRIMPYALSQQAVETPLYLSELRVDGKDRSLPVVVHRCRDLDFPLFADSELRVVELPAQLQEEMRRPDGLLCVMRDRWRRDLTSAELQDQQNWMETTVFTVSEDSYVYAFCCVKDEEGKGSVDGGRARPLPAWLLHEGFRVPHNSGPLLTSEPRTRYVPYRRFYSKGSTVRLGGPRRSGLTMAGSSPVHSNILDLSLSGASTTSSVQDHDQQQQLPMPPPQLQGISNLSSVAKEGDSNQRAAAAPTVVVVKPKGGKSPKAEAAEPIEVQVVLGVTRAQEEEGSMELDVRHVEVERSISDRMLCSRQYALLPGVVLGDPLYIDRKASEYALESLPPPLIGLPLVAIQTAQGDKRGGNSFALSFSAGRSCTVLVAYDGRAKSVPEWLSHLGFEPTGWTIPGPKGDFAFELHKRTLPAHTTLRLGGNNAHGAREPRNMYLVWFAPSSMSSNFATAVSPVPTPRSRASSVEEGAWHKNELLDDSGKVADLTAGKTKSSAEKDDDLALYWDCKENGRLRLMAPPFDTLGRDYSSPFNVDAISTTGQLETPSAVLGVSVKSLPGLFHRTRAVTLWPRLVVINRLHDAVDVLPLLRPTYLDAQGGGGGNSSRILRGTVASIINRSSFTMEKMATAADKKAKSKVARADGNGSGTTEGVLGNTSAATSTSSTTIDHLAAADCYGVLHPGECMVLYGFLPLRSLPSNLLLPPRLKKARTAALQQARPLQVKDEDKDESSVARALCFRLHDTQAHDEIEQVAFSHAVLTEGVGETCIWFWRDARGTDAGPLISANVDVHASTVFMTLRDSTLSPPYRIENRSSWAFLRCKQSGISGDTLAVGPMAFKSFSWQERDHLHQLKVSVEECEERGDDAEKRAAAPAIIATADFSLDEVGPKETLVVPGKAFWGGGGVAGAAGGGSGLGRNFSLKTRRLPQQKLYAHVSTAGRTRVITFSDMARTEMQNPRKEMALSSWTWSLFQELYNSLDIHVGLAGLTLNLLDMDPSGRRVVELLSLTLDRLEASKEGGKDRAQLALYHVQVDDMRPHAILPVVLQPADSGWHTPIRRLGRNKSTAAGTKGGGGSAEKAKRLAAQKVEAGSATPTLIPLIRVIAEPELHTPWSEVVHFRGLELGVQEVEVRLDVDALLSLVAYIGRLSAPDSGQDEAAAASVYHHGQHQRRLSPHSLRMSAGIDDKSLSLVRRLLRSKVRVPEAVLGEAIGQRLVYIELFHHSSLIVCLELVPGAGNFPLRREKNKQAAAAAAGAGGRLDGGMSLDPDLDEALVSGLELIGTGLVQLLTDMARSLAHLSGLTLVFNELLLTHYFGSHYDLGHIVALSLRQQALTQSYKFLGAMDLLGNPLNLFLGFGSGVVEFFRRTQAEMVGDADSKGEGLRRLAKAVIGGPFSSVSKITGTVASLLEEVVGVRGESGGGGISGGDEGISSASSVAEGQDESAGGGGAGGRAAPPQHLGEGILKGGEVFIRSMKSGVKNIYDLPQQGASREGFAGFLKGMGKGVVGALAAPLIGTLGGISRVTDTTAYFDKPKVFRRRRVARTAPENQALPLLELRDVGEEEEEGLEKDEKRQQQHESNKKREGPTET